MRKIVLAVLLLGMISWADLGRYDGDTKNWEVDTGAVRCTFFLGCMYPVWFKNAKGIEFPFFVFKDVLKIGDKQAYLDEERWATFTVVENTALRFIMECRGNYCYDLAPVNKPAEDVQAVYRYEFRRGSSDVKMSVTLNKKPGLACSVELCRLRWRYIRFEKFGKIDLNKDLPFVKSLLCEADWLHHASMDLRLGDHRVYLLKEPYENKFLYLRDAEGIQNWPAEATELRFETVLRFGRAAAKEDGK